MSWSEQRISRQLKLRDLHVLMTVARPGSMGKATTSSRCPGEPAISKAIADMETALGVRLPDRNPRGIVRRSMRALLDRGLVAFDELKQGIEHVNFLPRA